MHSLLFVPAKEKMLKKIPSLGADCFIIDLEDSIEESEKANALQEVKRFLTACDIERSRIVVRVNKKNAENEVAALALYGIGFMIPKVDKSDDYTFMRDYSDGRAVIALIESPLGLVNLNSIARADYITAIAFGAEDYTAGVGMTNRTDLLHFQKSRLVMFAKAYRKKVYDTPSFALSDQELFEKDVVSARELGFDGKMAINPKQLDYIHQVWADADIETIKAVIQQYESEGKAVNVINGKVYEKMHIAHMKKIVKEYGGI